MGAPDWLYKSKESSLHRYLGTFHRNACHELLPVGHEHGPQEPGQGAL